jgi:branched-chain amino acid transport system permease protein
MSMVFNRGRIALWGGGLLLALALPLVFKSGFLISLLCQMGIMVVFALSYNMLLGHTGLLSFGHAVYYGLGAFATMHTLNAVGKGGDPLTTALLPLVGGVAGLIAGVLLGYVTTRKAGTTFAMISLGIGELVAACSLMFPGVFGGEGGVSGNRVVGKEAFLGFTWGPQVEMYGLIVIWAFICTAAMFALTQTPLGRMANAVRDNPERAEFVGYDTERVRFLMVVLSGLFAGVAGGLSALNYEIVTAETLNAHTSGVVLLMTFVGGIGFFYGPIIGAILITVMQIVIGGLTHAWLLYFGLFFLFMVLMAPGGIASVIAVQRNLWHGRAVRPHAAALPGHGAAGADPARRPGRPGRARLRPARRRRCHGRRRSDEGDGHAVAPEDARPLAGRRRRHRHRTGADALDRRQGPCRLELRTVHPARR